MLRVNRPFGRRDPIAHRVTAIWFPRFAIECWQRRTDRRGKAPTGDLPVALARDGPHGPVVHAANGAAEQAGVRKGGRVADMRALCSGLFVELTRDALAEARDVFLNREGERYSRMAPVVGRLAEALARDGRFAVEDRILDIAIALERMYELEQRDGSFQLKTRAAYFLEGLIPLTPV